jgi:hypothetical protein
MRHPIRSTALAGLLVASACAPALASPATVNLRVEGGSQTLFEDPVTTDGRNVTTQSGGTHKCDGTNGGANPGAGPTMTTALDDGAKTAGFTWDGTYDSGFDDFFINRIGPDTNTGPPVFQPYWGLFLDWTATSTGGCQTRVGAGDDVLFAYSSFGQPLLELTAPARAATGQGFGVEVRQHDGAGADAPAPGAAVQGRTTGADGSATISFDTPGTRRFKATRSDAVRSNEAEVCVYEPGSGGCGTAKANPQPPDVKPLPDTTSPLAEVTSIDAGRHYRGNAPRLLAGTVEESRGIDQVMFRLRRVARGTCFWFTDKYDRFARARSCRRAKHVRVGDDPEWSYLLPERLERGRYLLQVRAVDDAGNVGREQIRFYVVGG